MFELKRILLEPCLLQPCFRVAGAVIIIIIIIIIITLRHSATTSPPSVGESRERTILRPRKSDLRQSTKTLLAICCVSPPKRAADDKVRGSASEPA